MFISAALVGTTPVHAVDGTHVVINEFDSNPAGTDNGREWVELYNPTANSVDLTGWTIRASTGLSISIPAGRVLAAKGYLVLNITSGSLANTNLSLTLLNKDRAVVDITPALSDTLDNRVAWARFPNGYDSDSATDWRFQQGTFGSSNGKRGSTVSIAANPNPMTVFQTVTVSGGINASVVANVTLHLSTDPSFSSPSVVVVTTSSNGAYSYAAPINAAGTYSLRAIWAGDEFRNGATSATVTLQVNKVVMSITLQATPTNVTLGNPVNVKGSLSPALGSVTITLTYNNPNGTIHTRQVTTFANGSFFDILVIQTKGAWTVRAAYAGDANHNAATSPSVAFNGVPRPTAGLGLVVALAVLAVAPALAAVGIILGGRGGAFSRAGMRGTGRPFAPRGRTMPPRPSPRAPTDLKPLKVGNGAICPVCFRPMNYIPQAASWICDGCGRNYRT